MRWRESKYVRGDRNKVDQEPKEKDENHMKIRNDEQKEEKTEVTEGQ
jgi:hypothetical protein